MWGGYREQGDWLQAKESLQASLSHTLLSTRSLQKNEWEMAFLQGTCLLCLSTLIVKRNCWDTVGEPGGAHEAQEGDIYEYKLLEQAAGKQAQRDAWHSLSFPSLELWKSMGSGRWNGYLVLDLSRIADRMASNPVQCSTENILDQLRSVKISLLTRYSPEHLAPTPLSKPPASPDYPTSNLSPSTSID